MRVEALLPLAVGPNTPVAATIAALAAALDGSGPAVVPVPDGPGHGAILEMARVDQPLERDNAGEPVALVVPTSGSTGEPKGALLTAAAVVASARATHERVGVAGQWLLALPLTHIAGLQVVVRSVLAGIDPVVLDDARGFDAEMFALATSRLGAGRRYTALVPTQVRRLLSGPTSGVDALASYDAVLVGGAALDDALRTRAVSAGVKVVVTYGMTETCGGCVYDGVPLDGVRVRAPADGPVRVGGPVVFSGYRLRPDLTAAALDTVDGVRWHITADRGRLDAKGRVEILGRVDDLIVTGGENVSPSAVERALASHPGVSEVVVLGVPDSEWGDRVVAVVVAAKPLNPPTLGALREHAAKALPPHAMPKQVLQTSQIPLLASGKIDRAAMRQLAADAARGE